MKFTVIGCGRWGSFITWYLDRLGHRVTLYGRAGSERFARIRATRSNGLIRFGGGVALSSDLPEAVAGAEVLVISIGCQGLRALMRELAALPLAGRTIVLCMKGLEQDTGKRLTEIVGETAPAAADVAIWVGPGHVQDFLSGIPNCMVVDSVSEAVKKTLIEALSGELIRFYYGVDLIGNEIGAASKNVIGIAAGMLDGLNRSSLKGALMSRGTREIARLITAMGGEGITAYGLSHLGDYEATVFSPYSHNRRFGELFVQSAPYGELAEGVYTVKALMKLGADRGVELPICRAVYEVLYENREPEEALSGLFLRSLKKEF